MTDNKQGDGPFKRYFLALATFEMKSKKNNGPLQMVNSNYIKLFNN